MATLSSEPFMEHVKVSHPRCPLQIRPSQHHSYLAEYNDIPPFKYAHMLDFFGGESKPGVNFHLVKNQRDLESTFTNPNVVTPKEVQIIEVIFDPFDIPWRLAGLLKARGLEKELIEEGFTNVQ